MSDFGIDNEAGNAIGPFAYTRNLLGEYAALIDDERLAYETPGDEIIADAIAELDGAEERLK